MVSDRIRRRSFLGGLSGVIGGVAGCGGEPDGDAENRDSTNRRTENQRDVTESQTDSATMTEQAALPPHDHSNQQNGGATLHPTELTVTEFHQFPSYIVAKKDGAVRGYNTANQSEEISGEIANQVIQEAINRLSSGSVFVRAGEYEIGPEGISLQSNIRLIGSGRGATILRLQDGINGRRGEISSPVIRVGQNVENVTIAHLEVDGNESGNRGVPPFPQSPHHHGIIIQGHEPQVPEAEKPSNVTVRDVSVHDTVRSNVVLAGRNCELENLWLANSATDHWLYLAGATNCTIRNVHASGFARTSGIVFGVGERRAYGTTLSDITISNLARTPYPNDQPSDFRGEYPVRAIVMRASSGNAHDNTVKDLRIRIPEAESGSSIFVVEPNTRIQNVSYRGPVGLDAIVVVDSAANGTSIKNSNIELTKSGKLGMRGVIRVSAPDVTVTDADIDATGVGSFAGIHIGEGPRPVARNVFRDIRISTDGPVVRVNAGGYGVPDLFLESVFDRTDRGTVGLDEIEPLRQGIY